MIDDPDPDRISTSYVERQNLTMRMSMRRYTRLTNGFPKKLENHAAATALHFIETLGTELNIKAPLLTATLITVGLSCTDFVRWSLRFVQQEASKTRSSGGGVH